MTNTDLDRVSLEKVHADRLDKIEAQLKVARSEALTLGLSVGGIDRALLALGQREEARHDGLVRKALDQLHVVRRCGVPAVADAALARAVGLLESALR